VNTLPETIVELARGRFPGCGNVRVERLKKGGSDRHFFRVQAGEGQSLIVVSYTGHREENRHYVDIGSFLAAAGVSVPAVYLHDADRGLIFMQDLGETDLWHWRNEPWAIRRPYYEATMEQGLLLHGPATRNLAGSNLRLEREFSEQLYLWEQNYFFEHCLGALFKADPATVQEFSALEGLANAARRLAERPRTLVHRDFQSQNVMIHLGRPYLIDFQGMRPGLPQYDLASLLYDPYTMTSPRERRELIDHYVRMAPEHGVETGADFDEVLDLCAMQRLMQALGAYGFLGLKNSRTEFLAHVTPARRSLTEVLGRVEGVAPLTNFLANLA